MLPRQLYPPFFPFPPFSSSCRQRNLDQIAHSSRVASQLTATATAACHRYFNQFCHSNWSRKRKTRWTVDSVGLCATVGLWDCVLQWGLFCALGQFVFRMSSNCFYGEKASPLLSLFCSKYANCTVRSTCCPPQCVPVCVSVCASVSHSQQSCVCVWVPVCSQHVLRTLLDVGLWVILKSAWLCRCLCRCRCCLSRSCSRCRCCCRRVNFH